MNITKAHLQNLLNTGTNQYIIPFFQRPYVWKADDCEALYEDIMSVAESNRLNKPKEHFIGTIITKNNDKSSQMSALFDLVDGQQRMTTFSLIMKALANCVDLSLTKANFLQTNINNSLSFTDSYGDVHYRIVHNRIDKEYFEKVMNSTNETIFDEPEEKSKIIDTYRFFKKRFKDLANEEILELNQIILNRFIAISMVLDKDDDEQEIFDTINSLGVKLTTSELLKNHIFSDQLTQKLYEARWQNVFEIDEETIKFWNRKKTAGRVYRENIDVLLYCYLLIEQEKDVSLEHLFNDYKTWLNGQSFERKSKFLDDLGKYAEIYATFPAGEELNEIKFDQVEKRFFHVIENLNITTIYPLVLFLYKEIQQEQEKLRCLEFLESYLVRRNVCKLTTKNYNNLFVSIVRSIQASKDKSTFEALKETLYGYTEDTNRFPSDDDLSSGFANSVLSNQHAKEVLYIIGLYQVKTNLNDITSLSSSSFSTEHIMPKAWTDHWAINDKDIEAKNRRNQKLLTLGNLTIITKNLNSKLRNRSWKNKIADLKKYSALPLTTNYTTLQDWNESEIEKRAKDLTILATKIWTKH